MLIWSLLIGRLPEQRVLATIRVAYGTAADKLKGLPRLLENVVREHENARFERCVQQPTVNPMLDLQQAVNFRIIDEQRRAAPAK